jgi:hypothetical protein
MNLYQYGLNNPLYWSDPYGQNVFGGFVSWVAGNGWDNSYNMGVEEAKELGKGFAEGARDGAAIAANELTMGLIDPLDEYARQKVCEYGKIGEWSQNAAMIGTDATYAALLNVGVSKFLTPKLAQSKLLGNGSELFGRGGKFGQRGVLNQGTIRTGWGWKGSASSGRDVFRTSWSSAGNRTYWNHIDWF